MRQFTTKLIFYLFNCCWIHQSFFSTIIGILSRSCGGLKVGSLKKGAFLWENPKTDLWSQIIRIIKGTDESLSRVDFSVPLMHHDPNDLRSQIRFRILPKKRTKLNVCVYVAFVFKYAKSPFLLTITKNLYHLTDGDNLPSWHLVYKLRDSHDMHVTWVRGTQMKSKTYNPSYFGGALSAFSRKV